MAACHRIARWLLLAYPPSIRRAHGPEILSAISDAWQRHQGTAARARLAVHLVSDALRSWSRASRRSPARADARLDAVRTVWADVIFACRRLRAHPSLALGVIVMLVVGVGLATSMFALSDPFLSRPLPYARADRLVLIEVDSLSAASGIAGGPPPDYPLLGDWQARTDLFDGLAAFTRHGSLRVRLQDRVEALEAIAVSANLFDVLGVAAPAPASPTVYDDEVWITTRGAGGPLADTNLTNQTLLLQPSGSRQVRGVLPPSFLVPQPVVRAPVDALVEMAAGPIVSVDGIAIAALRLVARLRDGVEASQAEAVLNADDAAQRFRVTVAPLVPAMKAPLRPLARGAFLAGLLVLVVCTANTLGMALTRGLYRAHQIATMEVLGAGRAQILRMLLTEGLLVAGAGTAGALMLVWWLIETIGAAVPPNVIILGTPELSMRVAAFAGLAGLFACAAWVIGSIVAWRRGARAGLRETTTRDGRVIRAVRFGLTAGQVAVTLILLTGAGLLVQSHLNLIRQDTGMSGETVTLSASYGPDLTGAALRETIDRTVDELRRVPGVRITAAVIGRMADQVGSTGMLLIGGWPASVELLWVSPDYFQAAGMSLVDGRALGAMDAGRRGVVVNEALVARYLEGRAEIGDLLRRGGSDMPIVGIVKNARRRALDEAPRAAAFLPLDDLPAGAGVTAMGVTYLINGSVTAAGAWETVIRRVWPDAVVLDGATLRDRLARTVQHRTFATLVVSLFAAATIGVTVAGLMGVVGYVAARRTREVGIRMALGARPGNVIWLMMRDAAAATIVGAAAGLVGAIWLSGSMASLVYGVSPRDWPTLAMTTVGLMALAVAAAAGPARRAGRLSPVVALREP